MSPHRSMNPALGQVDIQVQVCLEANNQIVSAGYGVVEGTNEELVVAVRYSIHPPKVVEGADQDGVEPKGEDGAGLWVALLNACPAPDVEVPICVPRGVPQVGRPAVVHLQELEEGEQSSRCLDRGAWRDETVVVPL